MSTTFRLTLAAVLLSSLALPAFAQTSNQMGSPTAASRAAKPAHVIAKAPAHPLKATALPKAN